MARSKPEKVSSTGLKEPRFVRHPEIWDEIAEKHTTYRGAVAHYRNHCIKYGLVPYKKADSLANLRAAKAAKPRRRRAA